MTLALAALLVAAVFIIVSLRRADRARQGERYNWRPEQDYNVEFDDGGPMTPPFPRLKPRDGKRDRGL